MKMKLLKVLCCLCTVFSVLVSNAYAEEVYYLDVGDDTVLILNNEDISGEDTRILSVVVDNVQFTLEEYMDTFCLVEEEHYTSGATTMPGIRPLYDEGGDAGAFTGRELRGTRTYNIPSWALVAADAFGRFASDFVGSASKYVFEAMYSAALANVSTATLIRRLYRNYQPYNGNLYKYTNEFNITSSVYNSGIFYGTSYYSNNPYESI